MKFYIHGINNYMVARSPYFQVKEEGGLVCGLVIFRKMSVPLQGPSPAVLFLETSNINRYLELEVFLADSTNR